MVDFSTSTRNMRSSEIRRLMKIAADPSVISFSGGMPNNSLFPTDVIDELWNNLTVQEKQVAFQYGPTPGFPPLLESLKEYLRSKKLPVDSNELIITTGALQAINILAKIFIDPQDCIITEDPSFIAAIAAFKSYGASITPVALDDDGINIENLHNTLKKIPSRPKMIYVNPYFHNPAGIIYSSEKKSALLDIVVKNDLVLLEDDPYSELYFDQEDQAKTQTMKSLSQDSERICYVGSFAKILGPGMRLGYLLGPKEIVEKCELAKQSMDACSSTFTQVLAHEYLKNKRLQPYLTSLRPVYKRRAELTLDALQRYMPEGIHWTKPKGGFYIWVTMPENIDSTEVFNKSIKKGAAFVIGNAFDPLGNKNNCFRLAFSYTPEEKISEGIKIISNAVKETLKA